MPRALFASSLIVALAAAVPGQERTAPGQPNIVFILAEDLGYAELGSYGQQRIRTPRLDRMAKDWMRFTQFYAGSATSANRRT